MSRKKKNKEKPLIPSTTSNVEKNKRSDQLFCYQSYKYPLFPNTEKKQRFKQIIASNRWWWNHLIAFNNMEHFHNPDSGFVGYKNGFAHELTPMRQFNAPWLAESPQTSQRSTADSMEQAFTEYFRGNRNKPGFKNKIKFRQSFTLTNNNFNGKDGKYQPNGRTKLKGDGTIRIDRIDSKNRHINLPDIGWVRLRMERDLPDGVRIVSATVSCKNGQWYVSVLTRTTKLPVFNLNRIIGIDVGVNKCVALSDGTVFRLPKIIDELDAKIAAKWREWYRKKRIGKEQWKKHKGAGVRPPHIKWHPSNNMNEIMDEIRELYEERANVLYDFLQKVSTWIAERYDWVVIENLNIPGLIKSNKGTKKKPGKNRKANKAKNKAISKQGWGMFFNMLKYKTRVIEVPAPYTSIQCCKCPARYKTSRKDEVFDCVNPLCENRCDADWNAAINIVERGIRLMEKKGVSPPASAKGDIKQWKANLGFNIKEVKIS